MAVSTHGNISPPVFPPKGPTATFSANNAMGGKDTPKHFEDCWQQGQNGFDTRDMKRYYGPYCSGACAGQGLMESHPKSTFQ